MCHERLVCLPWKMLYALRVFVPYEADVFSIKCRYVFTVGSEFGCVRGFVP